MNTKIKVIIVEDDRDLRESVEEFLNLEGLAANSVENCLGFYRAISADSFSVAVVDVGLPDQNGYTLAEYIRNNTEMRIIMLTARDAMEDRVRGYDCGADLYMVKPVDCRELAAAIKSLAMRFSDRTSLKARKTAPESWRLIKGSWRLVSPEGLSIPLTAKEMQFLTCLAEAVGNPVRRDTLLVALGYRDDEYANRAMDSLVRRVRRKIKEVTSQESPIKTAHSIGYCFSTSLITS